MCVLCAGNASNPFSCLDPLDDEFAPQAAGQFDFEPDFVEGTDAPGNMSTTYATAIGQLFEGTIESAGAHDYIAIELEAGKTYTFAMAGTGGQDVWLIDPLLTLRDDSGVELAQNDDVDPGLYRFSHITYSITETGTYYLDAAAWDVLSGQYQITVTEGSMASYSLDMAAAVLYREDTSWTATPGTGANITWAARTTNSNSQDASGSPAPFSQFTSQQIASTANVLAYYAEISGLTFTQVNAGGYSDVATILFGNYSSNSDGAGAYAWFPGGNADAGDVYVNTQGGSSLTSLPEGSYSYFVLLHEIGHALGLSHPGEYNADPDVNITYAGFAEFMQDAHQYTVMSYFDESNTSADFDDYPQTLMMADILTIQQMYGVNHSTRSGDTTYGFNSTESGVYDFSSNSDPAITVWDGGGNDTFDFSGFSDDQIIDLNQASFSDVGGRVSNVAIAFGAEIENAIGGSGNDTIIGNALANVIDGGSGSDTIDGGSGNDRIVYDASDNAANVTGGADTDTLVVIGGSVPFSYDLAAGSFELAEWLQTDTGANAWATILTTYSQSWQVISKSTENDDGSSQNDLYDWNDTQDWTSFLRSYNASDEETQRALYYDDLTSTVTLFDPADAQDWSSFIRDYNASNQETDRALFNDDGTRTVTLFDPADVQDWSSFVRNYNASNQETDRAFFNDDGTRTVTLFDPADAQTWSSFVRNYNASNQETDRAFFNDDGTSVVTLFDPADAQTWEQFIRNYNAADQETERALYNDDDTKVVTVFDVDDTQSWDQWIRQYDDEGNLVDQVYV